MCRECVSSLIGRTLYKNSHPTEILRFHNNLAKIPECLINSGKMVQVVTLLINTVNVFGSNLRPDILVDFPG
jgi:hypothetical protein